jgi:hypothetical protein
MIMRENLHGGEGDLVEENPMIGLRKITSQSDNMASEEGLSQDEKEFRKISSPKKMMKFLYGDYLE